MKKIHYTIKDFDISYNDLSKVYVEGVDKSRFSYDIVVAISRFNSIFKIFHVESSFIKCDIKRYNIDFCVDTPSSKSFFIFGGLYDPTTGIIYALGTKDRLNIPLCDLVDLFSNLAGSNMSLEHLNSILEKFKLSLNIEDFCESITKYVPNDTYSIIKRCLVFKNDVKEPMYKYDNNLGIQSFFTSFIRNITEYVNTFNTLLNLYLYKENGSNSYGLNKGLSFIVYKSRKTRYVSQINDIIKASTVMSLFYKTKTNEDSLLSEETQMVSNFLDIISDNDVVYSSDPEKMLRKYNVDKMVSDYDFYRISQELSQYYFTASTAMSEGVSLRSYKGGKVTDTDLKYVSTLLSFSTDIKLINRNILRSCRGKK